MVQDHTGSESSSRDLNPSNLAPECVCFPLCHVLLWESSLPLHLLLSSPPFSSSLLFSSLLSSQSLFMKDCLPYQVSSPVFHLIHTPLQICLAPATSLVLGCLLNGEFPYTQLSSPLMFIVDSPRTMAGPWHSRSHFPRKESQLFQCQRLS